MRPSRAVYAVRSSIRVLTWHHVQLRARYERALARDPALEGALDRAEAARWPEHYPQEAPFGLGALLASLTA